MVSEIQNKVTAEVEAPLPLPYAVVETGGKQYRVAPGDFVLVGKIAGDVGSEVVLERVLLIKTASDCRVGTPIVTGATVRAKIVSQEKARKVIAFKKKIRKGYKKKQGHRQLITKLQIAEISA